jgi:hypothetical protein
MPTARRAIALCAVLALALALRADEPARDAKAEEGFVPLFNGKNLTGWQYGKGRQARAGNGYQVDPAAGVLFCTEKDGGNLYTEKEYADFVLRFEFKLTPNANNGLGIRAPLEGDAAYVGMELQILDDSGDKYRTLRPSQYHGSIYDVAAAKKGAQKPVGEWNEQEVTARGRKITVKLNGQIIVDENLDTIKDKDVLHKHPGLKREKGYIGFLGHGTRVEFRKIRIKEL